MTATQTDVLVREADILAECFEDVRSLLKFYLMRAKEVDPFRVYEVEGKPLNTLYWLTAHLAWAEHFLLIDAIGGTPLEIPWLERFGDGAQPPSAFDDLPAFGEVCETLERVHERAMATLRSLSGAELDSANLVDLSFRAGTSRRIVVRHAIRHEPCHIGQIGWLIKAAGGETI